MAENENKTATVDVNYAFLKSKRGVVKIAELVTLFVAFVCFAAASTPKYTVATVLEFLITSLLLLLYLLKLNKRLTFLFWPLVDFFNSIFAAVYFTILSLMALTSHPVRGALVGGIVCFISVGLLCVDSFTLFKKITFNKPRNEVPNEVDERS